MVNTKRWKVNPENINKDVIREAASLLQQGETVAFPTETVYGLGADATNASAVTKIFQAKGRPQDNPLIAHVATKEQLISLVEKIPKYVDKLIERFSPGPITYVLQSNGACAANVTAGLDTIAVRIPDHPVALELLKTCDIPVAAPSANLSGKPSPTTAEHVWEDLAGKIAGIVDGGKTGVGVESTVIDCSTDVPVILRPGGITKEEIEAAIGMSILDSTTSSSKAAPKAPGMKYRHYAPEIPLWLIDGSVEQIQAVIRKEQQNGKRVGLLASSRIVEKVRADKSLPLGDNLQAIAAHLYDGLRTFKAKDVDLIVCEAFPMEGIGDAIMNRLKKASTKSMKL